MRLTCPNCGAQYEVPDEVIPEEGRDVQCSNCEKTWFQAKYPDQLTKEAVIKEPPASEPAPETEAAEETPPPAPESAAESSPEPDTQAASKGIDPAVANILKEEAAREADLRAKEGGSLEIQPDLALDALPDPKPEADSETERAIKELTATESIADRGQKDALPDVEAINSSLRSDESATKPAVEDLTPRKSGGGFMRGFALVLIVGVILLLIYSNAQKINEAVPQAEPILTPYVSLVDQARIWLESQTSGASQN